MGKLYGLEDLNSVLIVSIANLMGKVLPQRCSLLVYLLHKDLPFILWEAFGGKVINLNGRCS